MKLSALFYCVKLCFNMFQRTLILLKNFKPITCFDYSFDSRTILDRHLQDHHAKKLCEMCGDIFNSSVTHECLGSPPGNGEELAEVSEIF